MHVRNPWGKGEWTGKWSDKDTSSWTPRMKSLLNYVNADDGSFWMSFEDFCNQFRNVYICKLHNDWHKVKLSGMWSIGNGTACGCTNNNNWFNNPQYLLSVNMDCCVTINVTQSNVEEVESDGSITLKDHYHIGLYVIEHDRRKDRINKGVRNNKFIASSQFTAYKVVTQEVELRSNMNYIIIPCTFYKDKENTFILRVFCKDAEVSCIQL